MGRQDMKMLYRITKRLNADYGASQDRHVKNNYGRLISNEKEKISRWKEHFQSILNRPEPATTADIYETEEDVDVNFDRITETEVRESIKALKLERHLEKTGSVQRC